MSNEYYINKILIGKGTLQQFNEDYEAVNASEDQKANASQLYPVGDGSGFQSQDKFTQIYEYVIYYSTKRQDNRTLKSTGDRTAEVVEEKPKEVELDM